MALSEEQRHHTRQTRPAAPPPGDAIAGFRQAMMDSGLTPPAEIIPSGKIERYGDNGEKPYWYVLHLDNIPAGAYGDWRMGEVYRWCSIKKADMTPEQRRTFEEQMKAARDKADKARKLEQETAGQKAVNLYEQAQPATAEHPYLVTKQIRTVPPGVKVGRDGRLIVPVRTLDTDVKPIPIQSIQYIDTEGNKLFLKGGKAKGGFFHIGDKAKSETWHLCEGLATAASIHEATGQLALVAFNANNMVTLAGILKARYPGKDYIVCADNDISPDSDTNTGVKAANKAAAILGCPVAIPPGNRKMDFNDLHVDQGLDAVRKCFDKKGRDVPAAPPDNYRIESGLLEFNARKEKDGEWIDSWQWVGSALHVDGLTSNENSSEWGYSLRWIDSDRKTHHWAMPATMLKGSGEEYREELLSGGYRIAPGTKARNWLSAFIQLSLPHKKILCTDRTGWHGSSFVLPGGTIGGDPVVYQSPLATSDNFAQAGTLDQWRELSKLCAGNSRLVFAISTMFAGPLLGLTTQGSGGVHFRGGSSIGKTTALKVAATVWGHPQKFVRTWRATSNGLEGVAAAHSETGLVLDEIGEIDGRELGQTTYMLANGMSKQRAGRTGAPRKAKTWRLLFLSSGETDLAAHMRASGKKARAGQEVRLLDIEADTGQGMGLFEDLHGDTTAPAFLNRLLELAESAHGMAGPEFVRQLTQNRATLDVKGYTASAMAVILDGRDLDSQSRRAAERCAFIAMAGEAATHLGITGWSTGAATAAAKSCFQSWLDVRGGVGSQEEKDIVSHVRYLLEQHGRSRFERIGDSGSDKDDRLTISNRMGYVRDEGGSPVYLVLPETFKREFCGDHPQRRVVEVLKAEGILVPGNGERNTHEGRLPDSNKTRRYYKLVYRDE